jgi:hypothetical protein
MRGGEEDPNFRSFEKACEADIREHAAMTPKERTQIVIGLRHRRHSDAAEQGLARVCRIVQRERS